MNSLPEDEAGLNKDEEEVGVIFNREPEDLEAMESPNQPPGSGTYDGFRGCGRNREEGEPNEDENFESVVDSVASVALLELLHASDKSFADPESTDA